MSDPAEPKRDASHQESAAELARRLVELSGATRHKELLAGIVLSTLGFAEGASRLDLKIARSAITEMAGAFQMFAPYREVPKITIFGSARTAASDALYALTKKLAARLAESGCMVVTGAGPGIMAAGAEGAGPAMSIGVNIRLPFESVPNAWMADDDKLVEMKYFFTRKLMLMKESSGFLVLPGGFGTLDEAFELLTLLQTGKAEPAPIVLVDTPGGTYWAGWRRFVGDEVYRHGLAEEGDSSMYLITDDVDAAIDELLGFYANYHSRRFVGDTMVLRMQHAPSAEELEQLNSDFADICSQKGIWSTGPLPAERSSRDHLELDRIALEFDRMHHGRLRELIDALNALVAPHQVTVPASEDLTGEESAPPPS